MNSSQLVKNASTYASPMYELFRSEGVFVGTYAFAMLYRILVHNEGLYIGKDAYYCLYDHPDSTLRSNLDVFTPVNGSHISSINDYMYLMKHCLQQALNLADLSTAACLLSYKMKYEDSAMQKLVDQLFEVMNCRKISLISEANLAFTCSGVKSGILIDIGKRINIITVWVLIIAHLCRDVCDCHLPHI